MKIFAVANIVGGTIAIPHAPRAAAILGRIAEVVFLNSRKEHLWNEFSLILSNK